MKKRAAEATVAQSVSHPTIAQGADVGNLLPSAATSDTTTMIAIMPPLLMLKVSPPEEPAAPALVSTLSAPPLLGETGAWVDRAVLEVVMVVHVEGVDVACKL